MSFGHAANFHQPAPAFNVDILRKNSFKVYLDAFPDFEGLIEGVRSVCKFLNAKPDPSHSKFNSSSFHSLDLASPDLLAKPLPLISPPVVLDIPETYQTLESKITDYIETIIGLLNNPLAQNQYEADVPDAENVTERVHALQAGKLSLLLGMQTSDVLAMLFHDIARVSHANQDHGHQLHHVEGHHILLPLQLETPYSLYHGFAKFLLFETCAPYKGLISRLSQRTLTIQEQEFKLEDKVFRQEFLFKIMFMRLIDDMSKVPQYELEKRVGKEDVYFSDENIRSLVNAQMMQVLHVVKPDKDQFECWLNQALELMHRPDPQPAPPPRALSASPG